MEPTHDPNGSHSPVSNTFSNDSHADIILRSSDAVDFRVRKTILSEVSDVFKDMFTLPQRDPLPITDCDTSSEGNSVDGLPVVPVSEDAKSLSVFLRYASRHLMIPTDDQTITLSIIRLCYPRADHKLVSLDEARSVLKVLQKYDVQRIPDSITVILIREVEQHPTTVYAIACGYGLHDVANIAAKASLKRSLLQDSAPREDLLLMSAYDYDRFLRYHRQCSAKAAYTATSVDWIEDPFDVGLPGPLRCNCPHTGVSSPTTGPFVGQSWGFGVLNWGLDFMKDCAEELKVTPDWDVVMRKGRVMMNASVRASSKGCSECIKELAKLPTLAENIGNQIEAELALVSSILVLFLKRGFPLTFFRHKRSLCLFDSHIVPCCAFCSESPFSISLFFSRYEVFEQI